MEADDKVSYHLITAKIEKSTISNITSSANFVFV